MTALFVFFAYKQLLFNTFDPEVAPFYGVRTGTLDTIFALVLAAAIIASMRILGVTLIAAAIVIPPISARLLTDSFSRMLVLSTVLGAFIGFVGMYLSYFLDASSGATIVLFGAGVFLRRADVLDAARASHRHPRRCVGRRGRRHRAEDRRLRLRLSP